MVTETKYPRGSEWRKWDLHIHSDASDGKMTCEEIINAAIHKNIDVIALTDHHTAKNIDKIRELARDKNIAIIAGVEFRTEYGDKSVHLTALLPDKATNGITLDSKSIQSLLIDPLELQEAKIIAKGRENKPSKTLTDEEAFKEGLFLVQAPFKDIADKVHSLGGIVIPHAGSKTNSIEGMKHVDKSDTNLYDCLGPVKEELFKNNYIDICEIRNESDSAKFYLDKFNKPSIVTSDAHKVSEVGTKYTWIKADPTFSGLKQIIYEPDERVCLEGPPAVIERVQNNKTKYLKSLSINKNDSYDGITKGIWFDNVNIDLNNELVTIIGNKGSGKSAIADILGLLGNTHNAGIDNSNFSFLNKKKFQQKNLASNFYASMKWESDKDSSIELDKTTDPDEVETVKYLPQNYFETLTNELESQGFKNTLESVIFEHLTDSERYDKSNFDELKEYLSSSIEKNVALLKDEVDKLNKKIIDLEKKQHPNFIKEIESKIEEKTQELTEQQKLLKELTVVPNPTEDKNVEIKKSIKFEEIKKLNQSLEGLNDLIEKEKEKDKELKKNKEELTQLLNDVERFEGQLVDYRKQKKNDFLKYSLNIDDILKYEFNKIAIQQKIDCITADIKNIKNLLITETDIKTENLDYNSFKDSSLILKRDKINEQIQNIKKELTDSEAEYQQYVEKKLLFDKKIKEIEGENTKPGTLFYYKHQKEFIENDLNSELKKLRKSRSEKVADIYIEKNKLIDLFEKFKLPVDNQVKENIEYLEDYKINIEASFKLDESFFEKFLSYINQTNKGSFKGKDEGEKVLKDLFSGINLNSQEETINILETIIKFLELDQREECKGTDRIINEQISNVLEFYNYLYSLDYLRPEYELKLSEKKLHELSPGEKGALLLIFYLMIDKEDIPLIIDQPEDNLDNKSVFTMLTKFIKLAKRNRQIIIVTHNPNLAIGADAEQIIYVEIDKENKNKFSFISGSIESDKINDLVVDILEGTMPAFTKRKLRYKTSEPQLNNNQRC